MSTFQYHRPTTLAEAHRLRRDVPGARFVAGGTDVIPHVSDPAKRPPALISLRRVRELEGVELTADGGARIGALTRVADVAAHMGLGARMPALTYAAGCLGSFQIRNVATVGGNLCNASPCADLAPPLLVYDARVRIEGPDGARELPLDDFFLGNRSTRLDPSEILAAVVIAPPGPGTAARFDKIVRVRMDIALASLAALIQMDGGRALRARFAMGSVAPKPLRLREVESFLEGRALSLEADAREAGAIARREISPIDDLRATAAYRRHVAGVLVERAVLALAGGAT